MCWVLYAASATRSAWSILLHKISTREMTPPVLHNETERDIGVPESVTMSNPSALAVNKGTIDELAAHKLQLGVVECTVFKAR